jgi:hypothetical protein
MFYQTFFEVKSIRASVWCENPIKSANLPKDGVDFSPFLRIYGPTLVAIHFDPKAKLESVSRAIERHKTV